MDIVVEGLFLQIQQEFSRIAQDYSSWQHRVWKQSQHKKINSYWIREEHVKGLIKAYKDRFEQLSVEQRFELAKMLYRSKNEEHATVALALLVLNKSYIVPAKYSFLSSCVQSFNSWASVDAFCIHIVHDLLVQYPKQTLKLITRWSTAKSIWKRRASMVAFTKSIGKRGDFIEEMLLISRTLIDDPEVLVRKAVGWALKDHLQADRKRIVEYTLELKKSRKSSVVTNYVMRNMNDSEKQYIQEEIKNMDTRQKIVEILISLTQNEELRERLKDSSDLTNIGINSLIFVKLVVELEDEFDITFDDEKLDYKGFANLDELSRYIDSLK